MSGLCLTQLSSISLSQKVDLHGLLDFICQSVNISEYILKLFCDIFIFSLPLSIMLLISFEFGGYLANTFKVSYHSIFNANFKLHAVIGKNYSRTPIKQGNGLWPLKSGQSPFPREKKGVKKGVAAYMKVQIIKKLSLGL